MGLVPVAAGSVQIFGRAYDEQRNLVGYVPQRGSVDWDFPTNALDVVMMGTYGRLGWIRRPGKAQRETALHCLEQLGMADYADRQISQLSGGQQQRVFLARALAQEAELYFMDEPFVGVDATTEGAIVDLLRELRARQDRRLRPPRPGIGAGLFRLAGAAQRARHRRRSVRGRFTPRTWPGPTAAARTGSPSSSRTKRPRVARRPRRAREHLLRDLIFDYTLRNVALGSALLGIVSGVLGSYAVLRRQGLLGDALAHAALPGICIAFLLTGSREQIVLLLGAGIAGWIGPCSCSPSCAGRSSVRTRRWGSC